MKQIPLTNSQLFALVDDEDYDYLMQWKWFWDKKYARRTIATKTINGKRKTINIFMHRVINKTPDGYETDHINCEKLDNRKSNLRSVTRIQNMRNRKCQKNSTSAYKGVSLNAETQRWFVSIRIDKKPKWLGSFFSETDAARAYNEAAIKYFGEFAQLNIIENELLTNATECLIVKG